MKNRIVIFFAGFILPTIIFIRMRSLFEIGNEFYGGGGVFAYIGEMILKGKIPYRDIWDCNMPLTYYLNAFLFRLFGSSLKTVAFFEILWLFILSILIYKLSCLIFKRPVPLIITYIFTVYTASLEVAGSLGMAETYALLPSLLSIFNIVKYKKSPKVLLVFISGIMASLSFLFKQTNFVIVIPIILYMTMSTDYNIDKYLGLRRLFLRYLTFVYGYSIPILLFTVYFIKSGALNDLISQVFIYNFYLKGSFTTLDFAKSVFKTVMGQRPFLFSFAIAGALFKFLDLLKGVRHKNFINKYSLFIVLVIWFLVDLYATYFGCSHYNHCFLQVLPAASLLSGYVLTYLIRQLKASATLASFMALYFLFSSPLPEDIYNTATTFKKFFSKDNEAEYVKKDQYLCKEALLIKWINDNTPPDDFVYFWGADSGLNFLTKRESPSRYIYIYPLQREEYVKDEFVRRFMADIKKNKPKFIVDADSSNPYVTPLGSKNLNLKLPSSYTSQHLIPAIEFIKDNYNYETTIQGRDIYRVK